MVFRWRGRETEEKIDVETTPAAAQPKRSDDLRDKLERGLPLVARYLLFPLAPDGGGRLDGPRLARLDVVPAAAKLAEQAGLLQLPFEQLERPLDAVGLTQSYFSHCTVHPGNQKSRGKQKRGPAPVPAPSNHAGCRVRPCIPKRMGKYPGKPRLATSAGYPNRLRSFRGNEVYDVLQAARPAEGFALPAGTGSTLEHLSDQAGYLVPFIGGLERGA